LAQPQGSVRYDESNHVPVASNGCGKYSPYTLGKTTSATGTYAGAKWTFRVYVPTSYDSYTPMPVIIQHPGWGLDAKSEESGAGITKFAERDGFISVTAQGGDDNDNYGSWYSWNAVGSTQSPGPAGATCTTAASNSQYCYTSCGYCSDYPQCDWTTCLETVTPSGTGRSDVGGFIPGLFDTLEDQLCIDTTRQFAAGESNGGMQTYQLGVDLGHRLAGIAPQFGSFHRGYNMVPKVGVPVLDLHGTSDTTVPANKSLSGDGWYYTTTHEIFNGNSYSIGWKEVNGCEGTPTVYHAKQSGREGLWCVSEGYCSGGDVVRCVWHGGHNWLFSDAEANGQLVTNFLLQWTKPSHIGHGHSKGEIVGPGQPLANVTIGETIERQVKRVFPRTLKPKRKGSHYGNPAKGCQSDEDIIQLGSGRTCAPKIGRKNASATSDDLSLEPPAPACQLGGTWPSTNGCPKDAKVPFLSRAWPICLAKGETDDPYVNGEFHCMLVCPCESDAKGGCHKMSHFHCPSGSRCERADLRNRAQGVCTYPNDSEDEQYVPEQHVTDLIV